MLSFEVLADLTRNQYVIAGGTRLVCLAACVHAAVIALTSLVAGSKLSSSSSSLADTAAPPREHRAIQYTARTTTDPVGQLNQRIANNQVRLTFDPVSGYLRSVLSALEVPIESQIVVFSKTSLQSGIIGPDNPRTIFFNDKVSVAWPRGGFIEVSSVDPEQGAIFYTMQQHASAIPGFTRTDSCLSCHVSNATLGVPGLAVASVVPDTTGVVSVAPTHITDHRSPFEERWGGWYVTSQQLPMPHLGNLMTANPDAPALPSLSAPVQLGSLRDKFDTTGYLSTHSDVVALMVFNHQAHLTNLLTRLGWETRVAMATGRAGIEESVNGWAQEVVDYMLFVNEPRLPGPVVGSSAFAERFAATGPRDRRGRSLREFDLQTRLFRYPLSYLIYSDQFERLPAPAKAAIARRLGGILSGEERDSKYSRLTAADRRAILEILADTLKGFDLAGARRGL